MFPLLPLHWGLVNQQLFVDGIDPIGRVLPPVAGSDINKGVIASGQIKNIVASGKASKIIGSGRTKTLKGSGKLCP